MQIAQTSFKYFEFNLEDIKLVTKLGGSVDDCEMVDGLVMTQKVARAAGGPTRIKDASGANRGKKVETRLFS